MKIFGQHDQATIDQIVRCAKNGEYSVLCADGHKGYAQPIGGVVAYKNHVSVSGVGFDIACGNLAVRTDADPHLIQRNVEDIMVEITKQISFGVGRHNASPIAKHAVFDDRAWSDEFLGPDRGGNISGERSPKKSV